MYAIWSIRTVIASVFLSMGMHVDAAQLGTGRDAMTLHKPASQALSASPRESASLFISGHSLIDQPIPDYLAEIANSLQTPLQWNRQYVVGSSILVRTRSRNHTENNWPGYRSGYNRVGEGLDVVKELLHPETIRSDHYDALLITEQHALLGSLMWNDTVRYLRHYHERLIDGNPKGVTYFYEPWLSINDKKNPQRWIAYERAASPIWQCIATRINTSLAAEGRSDRIVSLPMSSAMVNLIEIATRPAGIPGVSRGSVQETVDSIFLDSVHNTHLGKYYIALVTYAFIYGRTPENAWRPDSVDVGQARTLQRMAWEFTSEYKKNNVPLSLAQCTATMKKSFINLYWGYTRDTYWKEELGFMRAYARWFRYVTTWHWRMLVGGSEDPFHFDSVGDKTYWFPDP